MKKNISAFTLVELIVVIVIISILATIGFISLQGFMRDARNSSRTSDIAIVARQFSLHITQDGLLPLPTDSINVTGSGTIYTIQGDLDPVEAGKVGAHGMLLDPSSGEPYIYAINESRNRFQLSTVLEGGQAFSPLYENAYADTLLVSSKGDNLGVVFDGASPTPIHRDPIIRSDGFFEIENESGGDFDVVIGNNRLLSGAREEIKSINPRGSCSRLKELRLIGSSGEFTLNSNGENIPAWCDYENPDVTFYQGIEDGTFENPNSGNWSSPHINKVDDGTGNIVGQIDGHQGSTLSSNFAYIKPGKTYRLSGDFRSIGSTQSRVFYGFAEYDENFQFINSHKVNPTAGTNTFLAADYTQGDSSIEIEDIDGTMCDTWQANNNTPGAIAFNADHSGDFSDLPNHTSYIIYNYYPSGVPAYYVSHTTVDNGDTCTINFHNSSQILGDYDAGTPIRFHKGSSSYNYRVLGNTLIPNSWTNYSGDINGFQTEGVFTNLKFRPGTKFVKILILGNYRQDGTAIVQIDNLRLEEISQ